MIMDANIVKFFVDLVMCEVLSLDDLYKLSATNKVSYQYFKGNMIKLASDRKFRPMYNWKESYLKLPLAFIRTRHMMKLLLHNLMFGPGKPSRFLPFGRTGTVKELLYCLFETLKKNGKFCYYTGNSYQRRLIHCTSRALGFETETVDKFELEIDPPKKWMGPCNCTDPYAMCDGFHGWERKLLGRVKITLSFTE
jgi:hypothetical protein